MLRCNNGLRWMIKMLYNEIFHGFHLKWILWLWWRAKCAICSCRDVFSEENLLTKSICNGSHPHTMCYKWIKGKWMEQEVVFVPANANFGWEYLSCYACTRNQTQKERREARKRLYLRAKYEKFVSFGWWKAPLLLFTVKTWQTLLKSHFDAINFWMCVLFPSQLSSYSEKV